MTGVQTCALPILEQNYPNPFNPSTTIEFTVKSASSVNLSVYNLQGQLMAVLVNEQLSPGVYKTVFDATNFPTGIYFYKLTAGKNTMQKKMLIAK